MEYLPQALASLAAIIGPVASIIGLVHSRGWLIVLGAIFATASIVFLVYAQRQSRRLEGAAIEIEGISIDAANAANVRRRVNRSLIVQSAEQHVTIDGADLEMIWRYTGYCHAAQETVLEFSVDSSMSIPFDQLDCYAFDLRRDCSRQHRIRPLLIGPDGISKKIAVPFLAPIGNNEPFDIALHCRLPGVYPPRIGYYTSSLSLDQKSVGRAAVHLKFARHKPDWVRVYACDANGRPDLLKALHPVRNDSGETEYRDVAENLPAQSVRIYLFKRDQL